MTTLLRELCCELEDQSVHRDHVAINDVRQRLEPAVEEAERTIGNLALLLYRLAHRIDCGRSPNDLLLHAFRMAREHARGSILRDGVGCQTKEERP